MQNLYQKFAVVVCLTISLTAFAKQPPLLAAPPLVVLFPFLSDNPDFFELSAGQKKQISMIGQSSANQREGLDQSILDLRAELREEVFKSPSNTNQIKKIQNELFEQEKARLQLSIDCALGLQKVLTKAQWQTLLELSAQ
jgi:hypothetical protein